MMTVVKDQIGPEHYRVYSLTRYSNANGHASGIVAVANYFHGRLFEWFATWGGCPVDVPREEAAKHVGKYGDKLSRSDAEYFFSCFPIERYRE